MSVDIVSQDLVPLVGTLRLEVEDRLRRAIVAGRFPAGTHLSDRALREEYGASRSIIREVIRGLEAEGLVTVFPNRGPFVTELTAADAVQIYELRAALEALGGEGFAVRASNEERARLQNVFDAICRTEDRAALLELKQEFYNILLKGSRNAFVEQTLRQFLNRIALLRQTSMSEFRRLPNMRREMSRIMSAIQSRDGEGAAIACREHVRSAGVVAIAILRERELASTENARPKRNGSSRLVDLGRTSART